MNDLYLKEIFLIFGEIPIVEWRGVMDEVIRSREVGPKVPRKAFALAHAIVRGMIQQARKKAEAPAGPAEPAHGTEEYWQRWISKMNPRGAAWVLEHSFQKLPARAVELLKEKIGEGIRDA